MKKLSNSLLILFSLLSFSCTSPHYEIILRNGTIFDGSSSDSFVGDVGISEGKIAAIGKHVSGTFNKEIQLEGLVISPGFIDMHAHLDPLLRYPEAESHIRQGVTTALGGPDGGGTVDMQHYLDTLEQIGMGMNVAFLVGHNRARQTVMGLEDRKPSDEELEDMKSLIAEAMEAGAYGISTGLKYLPGTFSELDEVVALSKVAAQYGGIYTSHLREEGLGLIEGVEEAIHISDLANIPVILTHHKVVGQPMWGSSQKTLALVDSAREAGLDIKIDQYPYTASFTWMGILIPSWSLEGNPVTKFAQRCADPVLRDSIKKGIMFNLINDRGGNDLRRVQIARFTWKPEFVGKTLYDWAIAEGMEPTIENGAELIIQAQMHGGASCIFHAMDEKDVARIMQHPQTMIASDGRITPYQEGHPHPRAYGTFPRVLGKYVREENVLSLEEAIYKMTTLPAQSLGLKDRGKLQKGYQADIVVFDPKTIIDKATFTQPHKYPAGIYYVFINGQMTVEKGTYHDLRAGFVLRKQIP